MSFVRRGLGARKDPRKVVADPPRGYFGVEWSERTLVPGDDARLAETRFDDWLEQQTPAAVNHAPVARQALADAPATANRGHYRFRNTRHWRNAHEHDHDERRYDHLLQGLGQGPGGDLSHGWPLSSDAWDGQMLFLAPNGFRVVAHDRRGHGRSSQASSGNDMDGYADDLAAVIEALDLEDGQAGRPLDGRW